MKVGQCWRDLAWYTERFIAWMHVLKVRNINSCEENKNWRFYRNYMGGLVMSKVTMHWFMGLLEDNLVKIGCDHFIALTNIT